MSPWWSCGLLMCAGMCLGNPIAGACFSPLADANSTDPTQWDDLRQFKAVVSDAEVVAVQSIGEAGGDKINLDFFALTFAKHPSLTVQEYFVKLRKAYGVFARGNLGDPFQSDPPVQFFLAYRPSDKALWETSQPKGALMSFVLYSHPPTFALRATLTGIQPVLEQGDVVATCATDTDFIFSTVRTKRDGYHPVSGNRGFGLRDNGDGTWTFYCKGADRLTKMDSGMIYLGNRLAQLQQLALGNEAGPDTVFRLGYEFWVHFFDAMADYVARDGMRVQSFTKNSKRYDYTP
jgi:hypothetical protein